jgi:hypothetical protein
VKRQGLWLVCLLPALFSGCGGTGDEKANGQPAETPAASDALGAAARPAKADFPAAHGKTLEELANALSAGPRLGLATSLFTPGDNRLAFGLLDSKNAFLYGKTAVYVGRRPSDRARGPFLAPPDSMLPAPRFRSKGADDPSEPKAVYSTTVPLDRAGAWYVLVMTKTKSGLQGAIGQIKVTRDTAIPSVGERAPAVDTDVASSLAGSLSEVDTRDPHDDMHKVSFKDVLGKRPVALLMSTPALCQSRVCGPVTDVAVEVEKEYGDRMTFIHQEVFVDNDLTKGYRPPLRAFKLSSEPWLFTVDRRGVIAARLQGAFGGRDFRRAVEAALK